MPMEYDRAKTALKELLGRAGQIAQNLNLESARQAVRESGDKLDRNFFYVAVLGQFKRGKSTFLNYILGEEVLPSGVLPLTSVITKIVYRKRIAVSVLFEGGGTRDIPLEELPEYCTEAKNPKNIRHVEEIRIGYPFDFISRDTVLIDTPGIASVFRHNTDVTCGFAGKADAVIFMLSADPPISEAERELIASLSGNGSRLFFLLNKSDYLGEPELRKVVKFNEEIIGKILNRGDIRVYPISALLALKGKMAGDPALLQKSGVLEPVSEIGRHLSEKKGDILRNRFILDTQKILDMEESFLKSSLRLREMSAEEIQSKADAFGEFMKEADTRRHEFSVLFQDEMNRMMEDLDERAAGFQKEAGVKIADEIRRKVPDLRKLGNLKKERNLKEYLGEVLISQFEAYKESVEAEVETRYQETIGLYLSRVNGLIAQITESAKQSFGMDLEAFRTPAGITAPSHFTYRINFEAGQIEIDPVRFSLLLPKQAAEKIILRRVLGRVDADLDRNLGRIRYDILERVKRSFNDYGDWLDGQIHAMDAVVTKLASEAADRAEKIRRGLETDSSKNDRMLGELASMMRELAAML